MDRNFSEEFLEISRHTDYQLSQFERKSIKSLDHVETLRPFMDWFADFINSDHCLTRDELQMFEKLEADSSEVYQEEDLNAALDVFFLENAKLFDDVVNESEFEYLEEECHENETTTHKLKQLQSFLLAELQNVKAVAETPESKDKHISKALSKIITGLLELNSCLNNMLKTLYVTWNNLKKPLDEFDENDCDGQFLNLHSMIRYKNESANFKKNLSDYFKFKFGNEIKSNTTFIESLVNKSVATPRHHSVTNATKERNFSQTKCKKLIKELESVKEHIKTNQEEKALALADENAYSLALEQMNSLIESFNNGMKLSISDARLQNFENSERVENEEEILCELTTALTLNSDQLSEAASMGLLQGEQLSRLRRQEQKLNDINNLMTFIEKRLHCDEYLMCFLENELVNVEVIINFIDDVINQAGVLWDEIQKNQENLMSQEDLLKKQAVQLCKAHPLISTLSRMYKLKESESNDTTNLIYTIELQNKIITDVSYQLAHLYNLGGNKNGLDSISYMRELTNNVLSGKARKSVADINKVMVPVSSVEKQISDLMHGFEHQKRAFEEHVETLTCQPRLQLGQSLCSIFLAKRLTVQELLIEAEKILSKRRKAQTSAITYNI